MKRNVIPVITKTMIVLLMICTLTASMSSVQADTIIFMSNEISFASEGYHSVQFVDLDGTPIASKLVLHGNPVNQPEPSVPQCAGAIAHRFIGWQSTPSGISVENITADVVFTAKYILFTAWGSPMAFCMHTINPW